MSVDDSVSRRRWLVAALAGSAISMPRVASAQPGTERVYNIADFGAKGDGRTLDTAAVQAAIDACNKGQGGTVLVPPGVFVIGTVELKSNVTLHIAAQGKLLGSADGRQYYAAASIPLSGDTTLEDGNTGLLFAVNAENITVEGPGIIDGQGAQFRSPSRGVPPPSGRGGADRPYHLLFHRCRNLRLRDINLVASAFHSVRVIQSKFVWMTGIRIHNRVNGNNDGFHFISSEFVHVTDCDVQAQDDACALFGSCKFVTVSNSTFSTRWSVFRFGGGDPENIVISNCLIYQTYGCPIKMQFGASSKVRNIQFSNLILQDVTGPISINLSDQVRPKDQSATHREGGGYVRDIRFQGIRAHVVSEGGQFADIAFPANYRPGEARQCIVLNAIGSAHLDDILFDDVQVTYGGGGSAEESRREIPAVAGEYFMIGTPPAYGLFARNVRGLTLNNVRFGVEKPDRRPAVVFERVTDAAIRGLGAEGNMEAESVLRLTDSKDIQITGARVLGQARAFLQVEGPASQGITVDGGDLSKAAVPVKFGRGASEKGAKVRL